MKLAVLIILATLATGCGDNIYTTPTGPAYNPNPPVTRNSIEFRVSGNATAAIIRYADPINGSSQVATALPFVVELNTSQQVIFLSLDVTPTAFPFFIPAPFLSAQIFVNGYLFREATTTSTLFNTISVSGTWRAN